MLYGQFYNHVGTLDNIYDCKILYQKSGRSCRNTSAQVKVKLRKRLQQDARKDSSYMNRTCITYAQSVADLRHKAGLHVLNTHYVTSQRLYWTL